MASEFTDKTSGGEAATSTGPAPTITSSSVALPSLNLYNTLSLDSRWDEKSDSWNYTNTINPDIPAEQVQPIGTRTTNSDSWKDYCFVFVQKHSKPSKDTSAGQITFEIFLMNPHLVKACKNVIGDVRGVSWNSQPIKLNPEMIISYFPRLEEYERSFTCPTDTTEEDGHGLKSLRILLEHMRKHYKETLTQITTLVKNREITFDLLYTILIPGTLIIRACPVTRNPRALKLLTAYQRECDGQRLWFLDCEYLEFATGEDEDSTQNLGLGDQARQHIPFGMHETAVAIPWFDGVKKISSLNAYPIEFWHPDPAELRKELLERAHTWVSLCGRRHVYYKGNAGRYEFIRHKLDHKLRQYSVDSRIMVDKTSFSRINAYCFYPLPDPEHMLPTRSNSDNGIYGLTDAELLLAPAVIYGFSLADKLWLEFDVVRVAQIEWNDEAFDGLELPLERKSLLRGLIEAHSRFDVEVPMRFDDFVRGKGRALVINLFGPPGVGKTLSAEATSEHLRRPLYVLGTGELGTSAAELENALRKAFELATVWRAVLLIDEADVFLQERSPHDLERNAMVAGFLRHLEYYHGILFMTTNRIQAFDEAFLTRIHIALRFDELSFDSRANIWRAFLRKAGFEDAAFEEKLLKLAEHNINGRQIKNACQTATLLAASLNERVRYEHLEQVLEVMEEFTKDSASELIANQPKEQGKDITSGEQGDLASGEIKEDTESGNPEMRENIPRGSATQSRWGKGLVCRVKKYLTGSSST